MFAFLPPWRRAWTRFVGVEPKLLISSDKRMKAISLRSQGDATDESGVLTAGKVRRSALFRETGFSSSVRVTSINIYIYIYTVYIYIYIRIIKI